HTMKSSTWRRWLSRMFPRTRAGKPVAERKLYGPLAVELLEDRTTPTATFTWTGGGANANWNNGDNWQGGVAPTGSSAAFDTLVFPNNAPQKSTNNNLIGATFRSISFSGPNYTLSRSNIQLRAPNVTNTGAHAQLAISRSSPVTINAPLTLNGPGVGNGGALNNLAGTNTWAGNIELDSDTTLGAAAGRLDITGHISDLGAGHSVTKE